MFLRLSAILIACGLAACAPQTNSSVERQALGIQGTVYRGTIIAMRPVAVSGSRSGIGATAGAVGGGFLGSTIGGDWRARTVGGVVGALAGGVAGRGHRDQATPLGQVQRRQAHASDHREAGVGEARVEPGHFDRDERLDVELLDRVVRHWAAFNPLGRP